MLDVLFPKVRRKLLSLLFLNPDREFHLREIVRALCSGKGAVERELRGMVSAGILERENRGNLSLYRANRECAIFDDLRSLVVKTSGIKETIREALAGVRGIRFAMMFGSAARGDLDSRSDIDVLVVGDASFAEVTEAVLEAQGRLGREISPTVYSGSEFAQRLRDEHGFVTRIMAEPRVVLIGDQDDIEGMGRSSQG
ncbi:nucleotidyltransferase domain-containing protein [Candidatus Fermentibacterales bacterium]|nr:nucleotidyltransferase domain-containing protein [Candidatus Fermentibacterales bacterium]